MSSPADRPKLSPNGSQLRTVADNVRTLREAQKLTLGQLATRSGVSKAALSKLEAAATNPTLETLTMLAAALSATTAELVTPAKASSIQVVRHDEGADLTDTAVQARLIHVRRSTRASIEVHDLRFAPGYGETSATHGDGSSEHVFVLEGRIWVGPISESVLLGPGDYAVYPAHRPHAFRTEGDSDARLLIFLEMPRVDEAEVPVAD